MSSSASKHFSLFLFLFSDKVVMFRLARRAVTTRGRGRFLFLLGLFVLVSVGVPIYRQHSRTEKTETDYETSILRSPFF